MSMIGSAALLAALPDRRVPWPTSSENRGEGDPSAYSAPGCQRPRPGMMVTRPPRPRSSSCSSHLRERRGWIVGLNRYLIYSHQLRSVAIFMVAALIRVTGEHNWQSKRGAAVHRKFSISMRSARHGAPADRLLGTLEKYDRENPALAVSRDGRVVIYDGLVVIELVPAELVAPAERRMLCGPIYGTEQHVEARTARACCRCR